MRQYLECVANQRLSMLAMPRHFNATNPFSFMDLSDVHELGNLLERRVSAFRVGVTGEVALQATF